MRTLGPEARDAFEIIFFFLIQPSYSGQKQLPVHRRDQR
jgi:hypothetical protein